MLFNKKNINKKRKDLHHKGKRTKHSVLVGILKAFLLLILFIAVCGVGFGYGSVKGMIDSAPTDIQLQSKESSSMLYDSDGKMVQRLSTYSSNRIELTSKEIPDHVKKAFVAIEDERFYEHNGVDVKGIFRALISDLFSGSTKQGASTITQQLIKNNVFNVGGESNTIAKIVRKIQEQYLALNVEKKYSKDEIITEYLNAINLGKGTLGIEVASNYYFGKKAKKLTLSEAACIASITKNPSANNPVDHPETNKTRRDTVLAKMKDLGYITRKEYDEAIAEDVYAKITQNSTKAHVYSYFTDAVITQLVDDLKEAYGYTNTQAYAMIYSGGLKVYTTQDSTLQKIADEVINDADNYPINTKYSLEYELTINKKDGTVKSFTQNDVRKYFNKKNGSTDYKTIYDSKDALNAAVKKFRNAKVKDGDTIETEEICYDLEPQLSYTLVDQKTGEVKVLVGGRGTKNSDLSLNRATSFPRQPGSTFKILSTYAPALDTCGMTLATAFNDCRYSYEGGREIKNAKKSYHGGMMTIRDAITESNNIVAVKTLTTITPQVGFDFLLKLGFTTLVNNRTNQNGALESDVNQALALGGITDGVNNLEMSAAYATIANKGVYNKPILYTKVVDKSGNVILENKIKGTRVMKETTSWLLTNAMKDVIKKGTGTSARLSSNMAVAGKTGTTSSNYDLWFCGYTPYYTASIWTGYDTNTSLGSGWNYHKQIWAKIMNRIIDKENQKIRDFPKCDRITSAKICAKSGLKPQAKICDHDPQKNMVRSEYFEKGTAPKGTCDLHIQVTLCKKTKMLASEYCMETYKRVFRIKPKDSHGKTDDSKYFASKKFDIKHVCNVHSKEWWEKAEAEAAAEAATATDEKGNTIPLDPTVDYLKEKMKREKAAAKAAKAAKKKTKSKKGKKKK